MRTCHITIDNITNYIIIKKLYLRNKVMAFQGLEDLT